MKNKQEAVAKKTDSVKKEKVAAATHTKRTGLAEIKDRLLIKKKIKDLKKKMAGTDSKSRIPDTAQKTITFEKMYRDGICKVSANHYSKMVEFYDINYDLLEIPDQGMILEDYSKFINYFDPCYG